MIPLGLSVIAVLGIVAAAFAVAAYPPAAYVLTTIAPYIVLVVFLSGFVYRIVRWGKVPVPFRIPTTCGQEKSLPWIAAQPLENPCGKAAVIGRMAGEIFLFRSLFRNAKVRMINGRPVYDQDKWLWFFGLLFHGALAVIAVRHLRFFTEPVVFCVSFLSALDGFLEIGVPTLYLSDALLLAGLTFLFLRRVVQPQIRYISLFTDYFALLLIAGIAATGLLMRHVYPTDLAAVKNMVIGWVSLTPAPPPDAGVILYMHLNLIFVLAVWLPWSKLMHMGGVWMSPTRNMINDTRRRRHINPWNAPVSVHTYGEYEDEFRDQMKAAGLPVEKE